MMILLFWFLFLILFFFRDQKVFVHNCVLNGIGRELGITTVDRGQYVYNGLP